MKLAFTNPTNWPHVRRGTERFINELARWLARRGHEITIVAAHGGPAYRQEAPGGYLNRFHRRLWTPAFGRIGLLEFHPFALNTVYELARRRYDLVMSCTFTDALAAAWMRRVTGTPSIFFVNGLPPRKAYQRSLSLKGAVFEAALRDSLSVIAYSEHVARYLQGRWERAYDTIPVPVDMETFQPCERDPRTPRRIVFAGAADDQRKGLRPLLRAFNLVKESAPDVELQIAYPCSAELQRSLSDLIELRWRGSLRFTDTPSEEMPRVFANATVTAIPSMWEPYGMVVLESMACGTPVVGTRDGGIPELISDVRAGVLFDPGDPGNCEVQDVAALAAALLDGLRLAAQADTAEHCRRHAAKFSYDRIGPQYEQLFRRLAGNTAVRPVTEGASA